MAWLAQMRIIGGAAIAYVHGRHERWGRLVKNAGLAGAFGTETAQLPGLIADEGRAVQVLHPDLETSWTSQREQIASHFGRHERWAGSSMRGYGR